MEETRLEIFDASSIKDLIFKKEQVEYHLLKQGWLHGEISLAINSHSGWYALAVIYKREVDQPPTIPER